MTPDDLIALNGAYARFWLLLNKDKLTLAEEKEMYEIGDLCVRLGLGVDESHQG